MTGSVRRGEMTLVLWAHLSSSKGKLNEEKKIVNQMHDTEGKKSIEIESKAEVCLSCR